MGIDLGVDTVPRLHTSASCFLQPPLALALAGEDCNQPPWPTCAAWRISSNAATEHDLRARFVDSESEILVRLARRGYLPIMEEGG